MLWLMPAGLHREGVGMLFISIDTASGAARSVAAAGTIRAGCRRLVHGRQMSGGKGAKGGNPLLGPYSGAQVFLDGLRGSANPVAEIAENAEIAKAAVGTTAPTASRLVALTALTAPTCFRRSAKSKRAPAGALSASIGKGSVLDQGALAFLERTVGLIARHGGDQLVDVVLAGRTRTAP